MKKKNKKVLFFIGIIFGAFLLSILIYNVTKDKDIHKDNTVECAKLALDDYNVVCDILFTEEALYSYRADCSIISKEKINGQYCDVISYIESNNIKSYYNGGDLGVGESTTEQMAIDLSLNLVPREAIPEEIIINYIN